MERKYFIKKENFIKRIFAVMLSFVLLIGATACGNSSGPSESGQDTIRQIEGNSGEDSTADSASKPAAEEPGGGGSTNRSS